MLWIDVDDEPRRPQQHRMVSMALNALGVQIQQ
jgi:hypothetical protein